MSVYVEVRGKRLTEFYQLFACNTLTVLTSHEVAGLEIMKERKKRIGQATNYLYLRIIEEDEQI